MEKSTYGLIGLTLAGFSLAAALQPAFEQWDGGRSDSSEVMTIAFGEGRKMFARHLYAKADAYFHSGYYPSVFDAKTEGSALSAASTGGGDHDCEFMGPPRDFLERFGRNFFPTEHRHLGEDSHDHSECDHDHGHDHDHSECDHDHGHSQCDHDHSEESGGDQKEMLPWLKLAAQMDPNRPETYVVAAYWLRSHLGKVDEAEVFVRDGLRANPSDPQLLFELGRIYFEDREQSDKARNLWELALKEFSKRDPEFIEEKILLHAQLLGNLARVEELSDTPRNAVPYLERLKTISPNGDKIQAWIDTLK